MYSAVVRVKKMYGLSQHEAEEKLKKFGPNIYWQKRKFPWLRFLKDQVFNYFNTVLFIAVLISYFGGGTKVESLLILLFLISAILVALWSEIKFHNLYNHLIKYLSKKITVIRDGKTKIIKAEELVPDDLVYLVKGEIVPADIKITKATNLLIDESILTGELKPVEKKEEEMLYSGVKILEGEVEGIVKATGKKTRFAKIQSLALETKKIGAYREEINKFSKDLVKLVIIFMFLIFFLNIFRYENIKELLIFALVLTISIIPEHLPAIEITALTIYTNLFSKKKTIIKRLSSIEDLGVIDILCVDKTGTITTNNLELEKIDSPDESLFLKFALSSSFGISQKYLSDFEKALEKHFPGYRQQIKIKLITRKLFDPSLRISQAIIEEENKKYLVVIGAPEYLINYCSLNQEEKNNWFEKFKKYSEDGFRLYALAYKENNKFIEKNKSIIDLNFLGIAIFRDSVKPTAKEAILKAEELGVDVKILTGDRAEVARKVALEIGLIDENEKAWNEDELNNLSEEEFKEVVEKYNVFARVSPEMKYKILQTLKEKHFIGFLGEGINDIPSLQLANVGLVVDTAIDAAKEIADIILLEKDLNVIIDGIYLGRKALFNTFKYLKHTMIGNLGNFFSIGVLSLFTQFIPLTALQIIITDTLTDLPFFVGVVDKVQNKEIKNPLSYKSKKLFILLIILGLTTALFNFFVYSLFKANELDILRSIIFWQVTLSGLLIFYSIRTNFFFLKSKTLPIIHFLIFMAIIATFIFTQIVNEPLLFGKLTLNQISLLLILNIFYLFLIDFLKLLIFKK